MTNQETKPAMVGEQEPVAWRSIESMAAQRYRVVPSHESMFYRHAVVAGDGTQQLYHGREVECENMARRFAGAFLDGAYVAQNYASPVAQRPQTEPDDETLKERDDAEDFIDMLLDEVLGTDRPEWTSAYGRDDALRDVQERMTALHKPTVDKAWDQFEKAQQPQARPDFADEWTGYLKDGETPFERFLRERKDLTALTKLYQRALEENERLKAQQPQAEAVQYTRADLDRAYSAGLVEGERLAIQQAEAVPPGYVLVPLDVLEAASESLGSFVSDNGWTDLDMQAMDNLDAILAQQKGQP